ncbi:MAG: hypothetical protein ACLRX4_12390 [Oscillospiraceae bacterium]
MLEAILNNLINIGWAMLIFLAAYLSNVAFSLYYNIVVLLQPFDKGKLINSGLKVATFVIGLTLLCVSITTLPCLPPKWVGQSRKNTLIFLRIW